MRYNWIGNFLMSLFPYCLVFSGPGFLGILALLVSFGSALLVGFTRSTWYGLGVWLVYLSGLLVLFLFFCSLTPNPVFLIPLSKPVFFLFFFWLFLMFHLSAGMGGVGVGDLEWAVEPFVLLQGKTSFLVVWMGLYLFLTMVAVVKVAPKSGGALRLPKSYFLKK